MTLPNFLVIGSPKSATTWIYKLLKEHPEVYVPKVRKDLLFFNYRFDNGISWYNSFFEKVESEKVIGEVTESYFSSIEAPKRIKNILGDVKMICVFRNPIDAAYSYYLHQVREGLVSNNFYEAIKQKPDIVNSYLYGKHLNEYLNYFDKGLLNILYFDDLKKNKIKFYSELCRILDIDNDYKPKILNTKENQKKFAKFKIVNKIKYKLWRFLRDNEFYRILNFLKKIPYDNLIYSNKPTKVVDDIDKIKPFLKDYYVKDINKLGETLNRDFSYWLDG